MQTTHQVALEAAGRDSSVEGTLVRVLHHQQRLAAIPTVPIVPPPQ